MEGGARRRILDILAVYPKAGCQNLRKAGRRSIPFAVHNAGDGSVAVGMAQNEASGLLHH